MAKNAVAKHWLLVVGEENRLYSDAPLDLIPPNAPVITATLPNSTDAFLKVSVPAVDARHPVATYTFEYRTQAEKAANGAWTVNQPVSSIAAITGFVQRNLQPSTQYWFRAKATDSSQSANTGPYSAEVTVTTLPASAVSDYWQNWPFMNMCAVQGVVSDNLLNPAHHDIMADNDVHMFQSFYPTTTRLQNRVDNIALVHAINPHVKFFMYTNFNQSYKDSVASVQQSQLEVNRGMNNDPVNGNLNWFLHRDEPNQAVIIEPNFGQDTNRQCNMGKGAGLNSLGETYQQAYVRTWESLLATGNPSTDCKVAIDGWFCDNWHCRIPEVWINNGASKITDYDIDDDGIVDDRNDYTPNTGGGWRWSQGHLDAKAAFETRFPGKGFMVNSSTFDSNYIDGQGTPPLPLSANPYYKKFELALAESRHNSLGLQKSSTAYNITPGSLARLYRGMEIQKTMLKDDPNTTTGRGCVVMHTNGVDRTTLIQDDYEYARLWVGLAMLIERSCHSVSVGASRCVPLDEKLLKIGAPLAQRSMGTLNQATATYSLRAPNLTIGVAQFWWVEFEEGIVVFRGDFPPGPYPAVWPSGSAVTMTLPPAGTGKHWEMMAPNYVNPTTGRPSRNLSPLINNGATVTTLSMIPMTVRFVRRVAG